MLKIWLTTILLCSLCLFSEPLPTAAADTICELALQDVVLTVTSGRVAANYRLDIAGVEDLRDQLRDGAHLVVEGQVQLLEHNTLLPDDELDMVRVEWFLRHDPLTREFVVVDKWNDTRRGPDLGQLLQGTWKQLIVTLSPQEPLQPGLDYRVVFRLAVRYAEVPPWLGNALFLWSRTVSPELELEQSFVFPEDTPQQTHLPLVIRIP